jgi:hypothetical protein
VIEVDSCFPSNWSTWNSSSLQPYLELYGEAHPFICANLTETLPAHSMNNDPEMKAVAPIYEYFWTIGISEYLCARFAQHLENVVQKKVDSFRHQDTGAEVTLFFPLTGGWRVEPVVASIKYVRPLPHHDNLVKKVAEYWDTVAPIVSKVAELTEHLDIPGVSTSASLIDTLAKVPITSLPPVEGLPWTLTKVTGYLDSEIRDGVQWTLPKKLFYVLGRRLTGSIAVYFHPAQSRQKQQETVSNNQLIVQTRPILAQAVVHGDGKRLPSIEKDGKEYIELDVTPRPNLRRW